MIWQLIEVVKIMIGGHGGEMLSADSQTLNISDCLFALVKRTRDKRITSGLTGVSLVGDGE